MGKLAESVKDGELRVGGGEESKGEGYGATYDGVTVV